MEGAAKLHGRSSRSFDVMSLIYSFSKFRYALFLAISITITLHLLCIHPRRTFSKKRSQQQQPWDGDLTVDIPPSSAPLNPHLAWFHDGFSHGKLFVCEDHGSFIPSRLSTSAKIWTLDSGPMIVTLTML
ncbi:hypothetical protein VTN02DRAFT_4922 [Thermoascus thermophilus]